MWRLKPDKACVPDGLIQLLPAQWFVTITSLFNSIFPMASTEQHGKQQKYAWFSSEVTSPVRVTTEHKRHEQPGIPMRHDAVCQTPPFL